MVSSPGLGDTATGGRRVDEKQLELALEAAGLGQFEWNAATDVAVISPAAAHLTGLPVGETRGLAMLLETYTHPDDLPRLAAVRAEHLLRGENFQFEYRQTRPDDGQLVWLRISLAPRLGPDGRLAAVTGVVADLTAQ